MKHTVLWLLGLCWLVSGSTYGNSFGRMETADIAMIDNKPAICLPRDAKEPFSVGWISLSESYVRNAGSWGVSLKSGYKPLELKPGACIGFDVVPEGYELDDYKIKSHPLALKVNRTYVFRLSDAYQARDTYTAVFCISKNAQGSLEYLQYTRLAEGGEVIPSCDANLNRNEGRLFGSEGKDYLNTKRDKVQKWKPLPDDADENIKAQSAIRKYGENR